MLNKNITNIEGCIQIKNKKFWLYNIYQGKKIVEKNLIGWRTALAHARKWNCDLFCEANKVEILNIHTGEIIELQEAEKRANALKAVNSGYHIK